VKDHDNGSGLGKRAVGGVGLGGKDVAQRSQGDIGKSQAYEADEGGDSEHSVSSKAVSSKAKDVFHNSEDDSEM
jgi:hypothetical protein